MPVLPNPRHEAFAQALAKGKTADEAYALAGYKPNRHNASRLKTNEHIGKRVDQVLGRVAERAEWSAADRLRSLKVIHDAQLKKDPRTAIAAISEANKMQGSHAPAKLQHAGAHGGPIEYANLTEEQIDARLAALLGGNEDAEQAPADEEA